MADFGNEEGIFWRETVVASLALFFLENVVFEVDDASDVRLQVGVCAIDGILSR